MRGEKVKGFVDSFKAIGSSPHARGKVTRAIKCQIITRIIPACAGKSYDSDYSKCYSQDHPRMRGEKLKYPESILNQLGSSPHARGKGISGIFQQACDGIIPACAGKRVSQSHQSV